MKNIVFLFLMFFLGLETTTSAQKSRMLVHSAIVTIHVNSPEDAKKMMRLNFIDDYFYDLIGGKDLVAKADKHGNFKFKIKMPSKFGRISIQNDSDTFLVLSIIEDGDNIKIVIPQGDGLVSKENYLEFSGLGSLKFIVDKLLRKSISNNRSNIHPQHFTNSTVDTLIANADSDYIFKKSILNGYKPKLSKQNYQLLDAKIFGYTYEQLITNINMKQGYGMISKDEFAYFVKKIKGLEFPQNPQIIVQSPEMLDFLYVKSNAIAKINSVNRKELFYNISNDISVTYSGSIREKLLVNSILRGAVFFSSENAGQLYTDALKYISNPAYKQLIENTASARKTGVAAYDFDLPDVNGKKVRLSDFKNKVVVVDFWFLGCSGCAGLSRVINEEVEPNFRNNADVVFVSINVDKKKSSWLKGIKSGEYTNPNSINLFTDGFGDDNQIFTYYKFVGCPQLLLVDKEGKTASPNLRASGKEMISAIEAVLNPVKK